MKRVLFALLLLLSSFAEAFEDPTVGVGASQYQQLIRNAHPPGGAVNAASGRPADLAKAEHYNRQKLWNEAVAEYEAAIASGADQTAIWIALSQVWRNQGGEQSQQRTLQAAYNAYRAARTVDEQARALFLLGELYAQQDQPKQAMAALKEGLGLEDSPKAAERYQQLVKANAFQVKTVDVESNSANPKICLNFSEALHKGKQIHYEDYLVIQPVIKAVVSARAEKLCVEGVSHGQSYEITVRPGVPSAAGEKTDADETFTAAVSDREPTVGFRGATYILPKAGGQGLPLTSVNVDKVRLKVLRINDRNLSEQVNSRHITNALAGYDIDTIAQHAGELLWQGELAIQGERNQEATTAIPVNEILRNTQPGIYVVAAEPVGKLSKYEDRATQWLVVSDLGLSTFRGEDGLHTFVRSLDSARSLAGVELRLYARNNTELGKATSDDAGYVRFAPGLLRGSGGREPAVLMAYGSAGDFNFLDLTRPAFDLADRGVAGREAPGPVDVFLYGERGVYRPGETVELMALMRDSRGYALENLPLTLKFIRPDEVEADQLTLTTAALGGYHASVPLANNARTGTWNVRAYTDPKAKPVGQLSFQVEDFVPQTLKLELATQAQILQPGAAVDVDVTGQFLYGAPAANLKAKAELVLREDPDPYPIQSGYKFGLVQDTWTAKRYPLDMAGTDAQGKARAVLKLDEVPDTSRPLQAVLRVSLFEPGGRPVNRSLALPYRPQSLAIGIRPQFGDGGVQINQEAAFAVVAVDPAGKLQAVSGLRAELFRESYDYYWYYRESRWDYKLVIRDSEPVESKTLTLSAEQPATLAHRGLDWGNYRLEVYDPATGAASSVRFRVGWFANPSEGDTPDQLRITLDKPRYQAGETAQVQVKAPFAGELLLTVAGDRLWTTRTFSLPAEGATVTLPVADNWGPGVYLTATAFRPANSGSQYGPGRAIGVTWLGLDPQPRTLAIRLDAPPELRPRQRFELPVTVSGAEPGKPAYLTVAAVDEGILQLTDFLTPDPLQYFLGKRRLGVDLLDLYGKLIQAGGQPGQLRVGGDAEGRQLDGSTVRTVKTVALFSGPAPLDPQGQARIPLELPDFNGQLRLMAIGWDASRLGRAEAPLLVRDPLVAQVYLPRFLAPGDVSRLSLHLQNLSAPKGDYQVQLTAEGAVALDAATEFSFPVTDSADQNTEHRNFTLRGLDPGIGRIQLRVAGPNGFKLAHEWEISVRPAQAIASERQALRLPSGQAVGVNPDLLKNYLPTTGEVRLSFSTRPNLNVPGLLAQLDRYPYGCLEQTTSRALPLLYFQAVATAWTAGSGAATGLRERVQQAVQRVLTMQRYEGGFGLWNPENPVEPWLSAYALDFLSRAKQEGYLVPESSYRRGLDWLKGKLSDTELDADKLAARAYALYVLARTEQAAIGDLRYLHDNYLNKLPTALSKAQLGAALARYGEMNRAREAFAAALATKAEYRWEWHDYGTPLRDRAALLALLTEAGIMTERVPQLAEELAADMNQRSYTSTQEQAWLLLAAYTLLGNPGELRLSVDGVPTSANPFYLKPTAAQLERGLKVANQGNSPVWYVVDASGVPAQEQPPVQQDFTIARRFYTQAGQEVNPAQMKQNDLLVAVITGEARTRENHQALIVDLLPAGLEIENARLAHSDSTGELQWLPKLSETLHTELRDDRFVAALNLDEGQRQFAVAYLVRAVTPGEYRLPAVFVEDMYKPWYLARGAMGRLKIE